MIELGIQKLPETGEYRVNWYEGGERSEEKSYYTDDLPDAQGTLVAMATEGISAGNAVRVRSSRFTENLQPTLREFLLRYGGTR